MASVYLLQGKHFHHRRCDLFLYPAKPHDYGGWRSSPTATIRNHPARRFRLRIKSLNYLNNILAKLEAIDAGVPEAVMINHVGNVSECTGDNIFIVRGDADGLPAAAHSAAARGRARRRDDERRAGSRLRARRRGSKSSGRTLTRHDLYTAPRRCF